MKTLKLLITCSLLLTSSIVYAESAAVIYEPHTFIREIAKPETFSDIFTACDPKGSFKIIVNNGDEAGENRISSAVISVNGVPVITQSDFNQKTARIEKAVTNIAEENTITAELNSKPWSQMTVSVEGVMSCLEVNISEPQDGATINKGLTIIRGTLESQTADVGIRVNGVLAEIQGENWVAAGVPLMEGQNEIKVVATDGVGNTDEKKITINNESTLQPLTVKSFPPNGIAPLETSFKIETNTNSSISSYRIDFDGDSLIDLETASPDDINHKYEAPGLYLPVVTVVDNAGVEYTEMTVVNVISKDQIDTLIQNKWSNMADSLVNKNIDQAIKYFLGGEDSKYKKVFEDLKDYLPQIYGRKASLEFVSLYEDEMHYEYIVIEEGDAISYPVIFYKDSNGLWKIYQL